MTILSRRNFLTGLGAVLAAPAIIRTPGLLMPIRALDRHLPFVTSAPPPLCEKTLENLIIMSRQAAQARYMVGWEDWRLVYGSPGL